MAARAQWFDSPEPEIVDLRTVRSHEVEPVLAAECAAWLEEFHWDFTESAELMRRYLDQGSLGGAALRQGGEVIGYSYFVVEDGKGMVGGLFILPNRSTIECERALIRATLDAVRDAGPVERIESQLMMLRHNSLPLPHYPYGPLMRSYDRLMMVAPLRVADEPDPRQKFLIDRWHERRLDDAARLIAHCYRGHIDADINDQYRSVGGARRFISNIINFPGCGHFQYPSSLIALDPETGELRGLVLTSKISESIGHVTQICTHPQARGYGLGRFLLRQAMNLMAASGCHTLSLTVTASNRPALGLYESLGFTVKRRFQAHVWDGL